MSADSGQPVPEPQQMDVWRLPRIVKLEARLARFAVPRRYTTPAGVQVRHVKGVGVAAQIPVQTQRQEQLPAHEQGLDAGDDQEDHRHEDVEDADFLVIDGPEEIPDPGNSGLWIHPAGAKLHVHTDEQVSETVLLR